MPRRQETGVPKTRWLTTSWCFELRDGFLGLQCLGICEEVTFRGGDTAKGRYLDFADRGVRRLGGLQEPIMSPYLSALLMETCRNIEWQSLMC